jgi:hypothetical protein
LYSTTLTLPRGAGALSLLAATATATLPAGRCGDAGRAGALATFGVPVGADFAVSDALLAAGLAGVAALTGAAAGTGADLVAGRGAGFFTTVEGLATGAGAALAGALLTGAVLTGAALAGAFAGAALAGAAFLATGAAFFGAALDGAGFLATGFFAGTTFFATGFFATGFLAGAAFFAAGFLAADLGAALAAGFLVALAAFFAGFFAATSGVSSVLRLSSPNIARLPKQPLQIGSVDQSWGPGWKKQCAFRQPCSMTLYLESALLYPAPATAATAFSPRFSALEVATNRSNSGPDCIVASNCL